MKTLPIALCLLLCGGTPAAAQEGITLCEAASSDDYLTKSSGQFLRGTANVSLCWLELFHQPAQEMRSGGDIFTGIFKGFTHTIRRGAQGIGELMTFPAPRQPDGSFPIIADDCALGALNLEDL